MRYPRCCPVFVVTRSDDYDCFPVGAHVEGSLLVLADADEESGFVYGYGGVCLDVKHGGVASTNRHFLLRPFNVAARRLVDAVPKTA